MDFEANLEVYDFATSLEQQQQQQNSSSNNKKENEEDEKKNDNNMVCVVQWNIERGTEYDRILADLKKIISDAKTGKEEGNIDKFILIIQELDVNCERSHNIDVPRRLCSDLKMNGVFVPEFEELHCDTRSFENRIGKGGRKASDVFDNNNNKSSFSPSTQTKAAVGGYDADDEDSSSSPLSPATRAHARAGSGIALHGNAILTNLKILDKHIIEHDGIPWHLEGKKLNEPRIGKRVSLCLRIELSPTEHVLAYTCHTEVFTGAGTRLQTYADCISHAKEQMKKQSSHNSNNISTGVCVGGDLNTVTEFLRLSPKFFPLLDRSKFLLPIWMREADTFEHEAFEARKGILSQMMSQVLLGTPLRALKVFDKNDLGLIDPCESGTDDWVTLIHKQHTYFGLSPVQAKLDWLITSSLIPSSPSPPSQQQTKQEGEQQQQQQQQKLYYSPEQEEERFKNLLYLIPFWKRIFNRDFTASDHCGIVAYFKSFSKEEVAKRTEKENVGNENSEQKDKDLFLIKNILSVEKRKQAARQRVPIHFFAWIFLVITLCVYGLKFIVTFLISFRS